MIMELWVAIMAIGVCTGATRIAPLFFAGRRKENDVRRPAWLNSLGPCLLAAMAVVAILPVVQSSVREESITPTAISFAVVAAVMIIRRDPGLATIGGMLAYFLLS